MRALLAPLLVMSACSSFTPSEPSNDAGGIDASVPPDDGGSACGAAFCASFDEGDFTAGWTGTTVAGGSLGFDTASFVSPPRALRAAAPATAEPRIAALYRDFPTARGMHCRIALKASTLGSSSRSVDFLWMEAKTPDGRDAVLVLGSNEGAPSVREDVILPDGGCGCPLHREAFPTPLAADRFQTIDVRWSSSGIVLVDVDGANAANRQFTAIGGPGGIRLYLGLRAHEPDLAGDVTIDDVVCDLDQ